MVLKWVENPYWQYFCGEVTFQHELPCDFTTLGKWRKRIAAQGFEDLLKETIQTGLRTGAVRQEDFARVNIDTTVQEKSVTFPTDASSYTECESSSWHWHERWGLSSGKRTQEKVAKLYSIKTGVLGLIHRWCKAGRILTLTSLANGQSKTTWMLFLLSSFRACEGVDMICILVRNSCPTFGI